MRIQRRTFETDVEMILMTTGMTDQSSSNGGSSGILKDRAKSLLRPPHLQSLVIQRLLNLVAHENILGIARHDERLDQRPALLRIQRCLRHFFKVAEGAVIPREIADIGIAARLMTLVAFEFSPSSLLISPTTTGTVRETGARFPQMPRPEFEPFHRSRTQTLFSASMQGLPSGIQSRPPVLHRWAGQRTHSVSSTQSPGSFHPHPANGGRRDPLPRNGMGWESIS